MSSLSNPNIVVGSVFGFSLGIDALSLPDRPSLSFLFIYFPPPTNTGDAYTHHSAAKGEVPGDLVTSSRVPSAPLLRHCDETLAIIIAGHYSLATRLLFDGVGFVWVLFCLFPVWL